MTGHKLDILMEEGMPADVNYCVHGYGTGAVACKRQPRLPGPPPGPAPRPHPSHAAWTSSPGAAPRAPRQRALAGGCAARGGLHARSACERRACRRRGASGPGEAAPRGGRQWAGRGGARPGEGCAAAPPAAPGSRSPGRQERAAVGGACGDWRAGGEVGSTLFFMLMREWGLSVFTLRREPPPFIHPHGPSRCRRCRPARAFAPLRALGRGRGGGDDPRRAAAARAPPRSPLRGAGRTPGPVASGRSKAEAGGEAGARARGGQGEDGGGYSSRYPRGPNTASEAF
nr:translation initiation factor IF-2 [Oryctolagus cuniculus]